MRAGWLKIGSATPASRYAPLGSRQRNDFGTRRTLTATTVPSASSYAYSAIVRCLTALSVNRTARSSPGAIPSVRSTLWRGHRAKHVRIAPTAVCLSPSEGRMSRWCGQKDFASPSRTNRGRQPARSSAVNARSKHSAAVRRHRQARKATPTVDSGSF